MYVISIMTTSLSLSEGLVSPNGSSPGSRKSSIGSPTSPTLGIFVQGSPIEKIRASLKHLEDKRNAYLTQKHVIGKVSGRKADLAYEMVHVNFRRVNFKWQLGYKIGKANVHSVRSVFRCTFEPRWRSLLSRTVFYFP